MSKVYIGVGHGGNDYGACANGLKESEVALDIALECHEILRQHGVYVKISRTTQGSDYATDLNTKIQDCNAFDPALAVDIHINAGGGEGFEAFHYHKGGASFMLAKNIEAEVKKIGQISRGLKTKLNSNGQDFFGWIRLVNAPSVILEAAFIDNINDVSKICTKKGRSGFAVSFAKGILNTLGITYNQNGSEGQENAVNTIYKKYEDISDYAKPTIKKLMDKGALQGDKDGNLNLSEEMVRTLVIVDRAYGDKK